MIVGGSANPSIVNGVKVEHVRGDAMRSFGIGIIEADGGLCCEMIGCHEENLASMAGLRERRSSVCRNAELTHRIDLKQARLGCLFSARRWGGR